MQIATISTRQARLQSLLSMKLIQRHVCDITTIRTTSQKTTPTAKQPLFRAPRGKLMVFYSSLAVSHGVEVRSRTNEAKTAAFEQRHSCRIQANRRSARGNASSISSFIDRYSTAKNRLAANVGASRRPHSRMVRGIALVLKLVKTTVSGYPVLKEIFLNSQNSRC